MLKFPNEPIIHLRAINERRNILEKVFYDFDLCISKHFRSYSVYDLFV